MHIADKDQVAILVVYDRSKSFLLLSLLVPNLKFWTAGRQMLFVPVHQWRSS